MKQYLVVLLSGFLVTTSSAVALSDTEKNLCSEESGRRLTRLEFHGDTRFTEFKFDTDHAYASTVDFAELGGDSGRKRRKRKTPPTAAAPQMGELLTMRAMGKEKNGWRNLTVRCGINRGKIATFTYEILDTNTAGDFPPLSASLQAPTREAQIHTSN